MIISRALKILFNSSGSQTVNSALILVIRSVIPLVAIFLIRHYVDSIVNTSGEGLSANLRSVTGLIAALALTILADDLLQSIGHYVSKRQGYLIENHIASLIHSHAVKMGLKFFEDPAFHDRLSRAVRDISWRPAAILSDLILSFRGVLSFAAMGFILRDFGIIPLAGLAVIFLPVLFLRLRNSERLYEVKKSVTANSRQASYFSWLLTAEKPAREVRLFSLGRFFEKHFRISFAASKEPELRVVGTNAIYEGLASVIKALAFAGVLIYATFRYIDSGITAGEMAMYLIAFRQAVVYLRDAVSGLSGLAENRLFLNDLFLFLDMESDMPVNKNASGINSFSELEAVNLTFTYPGAGQPAVRDVSLRIRRGERVAIVGPNGSGKTTLVKLLCRLYDPGSGDVMLDGASVTRFDPDEYRRLFSVVFQDFMLYYLSARDNISLADTAGSGDNVHVREAAAKTGISGVLEGLPEGYETILGHHTEGGRELSWGEWQKIAIARALYRDAPLLVLDEPTSSLDADSEFEIFSDLERIAEGRTLILISHRLAYVRNADQIIVLDGGRVAEKGTHDGLMAARGKYHAMFTKQKSNYI